MTITTQRTDPPRSALEHAEKNFRPSVVERDLYDWWERSRFFTPPEDDDGRRFVMMLPLPNVTGDLHLGHALSFGGYEDLMARWHRMKGEATLYLPGSDSAGIIAQIVVEKELAKEGIGRQGLTREQFLAEMWTWMKHYQPRIYAQLRMLGCSLDWTRVHFPMDPDMQRRVRIHFIRLYRKGHLYRADRVVHWCLTCQTTYSDLEVEHVERTDPLYYVRYPWADGTPTGAPDLVVATTRPETILADVAVAVNSRDERWQRWIGHDVLVPVAERRVKIIADDAVDPAFGTGALKVTPGHDATDFEIGQRHHLPVMSVIGKDGRMLPAAGPLAGLDRDSARREMVDRLRKSGLLLREEPLAHGVGVHDRCDTVDEPLVVTRYLGAEGLSRTAFELSSFLPVPWTVVTHEITAGTMEGGVGEGATLFGETRRRPSYYAHLKNFWDISDETNVELGGTYLLGSSDADARAEVNAFGVDATLVHFFTPTQKFKWQSELYVQNRDEHEEFEKNPWGLYSLMDFRLSPRFGLGGRFDYVEPVDLDPATIARDGDTAWASYLTFYQSEFTRWRLQYRHTEFAQGGDDDAVFVQGTVAIGVHKHALQ